MRIAVISDVHGNLLGLETALDDLRRDPADQIVCLGDMIQGGPQPAEVAERLRELACPVVMGNAEQTYGMMRASFPHRITKQVRAEIS